MRVMPLLFLHFALKGMLIIIESMRFDRFQFGRLIHAQPFESKTT
jgi:hypothetical protein